MDITVVIILAVAGISAIVLAFLFISLVGERGSVRTQLKNIVSSQRKVSTSGAFGIGARKNVLETAREGKVQKTATAELTLRKRLKYAQWKISPLIFRVLEVLISIVVVMIVRVNFGILMQCIAALSGPIFMRWLVNVFMDRRFKRFDSDYPQMLLSLVGLLKTGMNAMTALEAAAEGLEEGSLVKHEIVMMIERLRFGVSEERSIGAFGETIYHPEIELFVQALLLSIRVGGSLSDTLERLAKQVRKRQYFRNSAQAAIGMQRGSIWFILAILVSLEVYLYFVYPQAVEGAWADELGWQVWQFGITVVLLGLFWIRQVTKIRT